MIGMNLWFIPQISEHWPNKILGDFVNNKVWLIRPGIASILIPIEGIVQEWITSIDEINNRMGVLYGITSRLSTSNKRKLNFFEMGE